MTNCDKKNPADSVHARGASQTGCRKHWARGGEGQRLRLRCAPQQGSRGRPAIRGGEMSETKSPHSGLTRRNFLKATAAVGYERPCGVGCYAGRLFHGDRRAFAELYRRRANFLDHLPIQLLPSLLAECPRSRWQGCEDVPGRLSRGDIFWLLPARTEHSRANL